MNKPTYLLAVFDRSNTDRALIAKAAKLARRFGARLELFMCDADHAYTLKHEYEPSHSDDVRRGYMAHAIEYLVALQATSGLHDVQTSISAACESPLYEGIVHKVLQSHPDLVIKNASGVHSPASAPFDPNDWQLMRRCPVTLLMTRGRIWHSQPTFAAAVDVSEAETGGLARGILEMAAMFSAAHDSETDVLYAERSGAAEYAKEIHSSALRKLAQECHVAADRVRIMQGDPEQALPAAVARSDYDVLTLGALTHRPGAVTLVGTLTSKLVDTVNCDLILVKP